MSAIVGSQVEEAAHWLEKGDVVAIPTETVYGLAANAFNPDAIVKVYTVKDRPRFNPLIVHVANLSQAKELVTEMPEEAVNLAKKFWPGPLTMLFPKSELVSDLVTAGSPMVAIRVPAHPLTQALLQRLKFPLVAPSANPFGFISPTEAKHVASQLGEKIPYILDGGACRVGVESTILGFTEEGVKVYRYGGLAAETLEPISGPLIAPEASTTKPDAPGMLKSHYSPRTPLILGSRDNLGEYKPEETGAISFSHWREDIPQEHQIVLSESGDFGEAAQRLFAGLHHLDSLGLKVILAEKLPEVGLGRAINDRLNRAEAGHQVN